MDKRFTKGVVYKSNPLIEESGERYIFSHYNEYGSAFFFTVGRESEIDEMFWLSAPEIADEVLVEA